MRKMQTHSIQSQMWFYAQVLPFPAALQLPFCKMFLMTPSSCCILHRYPCPFYRVWNGSYGLFLLIPCLAPYPMPSPWSTHTYPLWFKEILLQKTLAQYTQDDLSVGTHIGACQLPLKDQIMSHCSCFAFNTLWKKWKSEMRHSVSRKNWQKASWDRHFKEMILGT